MFRLFETTLLVDDNYMNDNHIGVACKLVRRCCKSWILAAMFTLSGVCCPLFAQQTENRVNQDYYAPRGPVEARTLNNVMHHHFGPGRDRTAAGNFGAALSDFEFILNYFPNHPQVLVALSELCEKWRTAACDLKAEQWFQRAITLNPSAGQSHVLQAMHYHRRNKLDEAVKSYKRALDVAPESLNAHYNLGLVYTDLKQYELANLHAQKSYALGAQYPGLRNRLQKAGKWNPNVTLPASSAKPAADPAPEAGSEKKPE